MRITRAGTPATTAFSGTSRVSTELVPTMQLSPTVTQGTLSFPGHAGLNKVVFQGRISPSKRLGLGAYALGITATNSVGERSSPRSLNFTIVK